MQFLPLLLSGILPFLSTGFLLIAAIIRSDIRRSGLFLTAAVIQILIIVISPIINLVVYPNLIESYSASQLTLFFTVVGFVTSLFSATATCLIAIAILGQRPAKD
jgi:hypothetical protein